MEPSQIALDHVSALNIETCNFHKMEIPFYCGQRLFDGGITLEFREPAINFDRRPLLMKFQIACLAYEEINGKRAPNDFREPTIKTESYLFCIQSHI